MLWKKVTMPQSETEKEMQDELDKQKRAIGAQKLANMELEKSNARLQSILDELINKNENDE